MSEEKTSNLNEIETRNGETKPSPDLEIKKSQEGAFQDWQSIIGGEWEESNHEALIDASDKKKASYDLKLSEKVGATLKQQEEDLKTIKEYYEREVRAMKYGFEKEGAVAITG